jgi:hypothetical protein
MIKRSSVTINNNHFKKITFIATAIILLSVTATFGFSPNDDAFAKKRQEVIDWSNGFPSGEHANLNIHGKKLDPFYNCDNSVESEPFGKSIFVQIEGTSKIEFVSNKRASGFSILQVLDPCAAPFGQENTPDAALVQLEAKEMQVYWRILGKPDNGGSPSTAMLASPKLIEACNFLPIAFENGSIVNSFDPDALAGGTGLALVAFTALEKHTEDVALNGMFDVGESIYLDEGDGVVGLGDVLLAGPGVDPTAVLVGFTAFELHEDSTANNMFDAGETVYLDADMDGFVSAGDTRLANASSQGLSDTEGGDEIDCSKDFLVGLGLINNKGVFDLEEDQTLKRFDPATTEKGKGKSKAVDITGLFTWTGVLCDPLTDADVNEDGEISLADDFPGLMEADVKAAAEAAGVYEEDGMIDDAEFAAYIAATYPDCFAFYNEWIFIIADIVRYGIDYVNDGTTLTQMRFYPVATTTFD